MYSVCLLCLFLWNCRKERGAGGGCHCAPLHWQIHPVCLPCHFLWVSLRVGCKGGRRGEKECQCDPFIGRYIQHAHSCAASFGACIGNEGVRGPVKIWRRQTLMFLQARGGRGVVRQGGCWALGREFLTLVGRVGRQLSGLAGGVLGRGEGVQC